MIGKFRTVFYRLKWHILSSDDSHIYSISIIRLKIEKNNSTTNYLTTGANRIADKIICVNRETRG